MVDDNPRKHPGQESGGSPEPKVVCEVCLTEIPRTEARSAEGAEYVRHFCGLDCYQRWLDGTDQENGPGRGEGSAPS